MRRLDPAGPHRVAGDAMAGDQVEHGIGGAAGHLDQGMAVAFAEAAQQFVGIVLEAGDHLAAVAARGAPAGFVRIDHAHRDAALGQVQGARQPRVAGADDRDVGRHRFGQRRRVDAGRRGGGPQRGRQGRSEGGAHVADTVEE